VWRLQSANCYIRVTLLYFTAAAAAPATYYCYYYYYIRLTAFFSRTTWVSQHQKGKPFWILLEQEMMGWQWHQMDHMQIICTLLQTDNHR